MYFSLYCSKLDVSACPKGTYGRDCASVCKGYCKNGCNSVTGKCDNGCEPGWYTDECHSGELTPPPPTPEFIPSLISEF